MDDWNTHFVKQCNVVRAEKNKAALTVEQGIQLLRAFNYDPQNRDRVWNIDDKRQAQRNALINAD